MTSLNQWKWFESTQGDSEGKGSLACCSLWGRKESNIEGDSTPTSQCLCVPISKCNGLISKKIFLSSGITSSAPCLPLTNLPPKVLLYFFSFTSA